MTERTELLDLLRGQLRKVNPAVPADLAPDVELMSELRLDSLDVVEFVARVEEHFRFAVPDDQWKKLSCLGRIADYVLAQAPRAGPRAAAG